MPTPDKQTLRLGYKKTMDDMRHDLSTTERIHSRVVHSSVGSFIGVLFGSILLRPRSLMTGAAVSFVTLVCTYIIALIDHVPFNATESLIAFGFGWCIGLLYDLFFVISHSHKR